MSHPSEEQHKPGLPVNTSLAGFVDTSATWVSGEVENSPSDDPRPYPVTAVPGLKYVERGTLLAYRHSDAAKNRMIDR